MLRTLGAVAIFALLSGAAAFAQEAPAASSPIEATAAIAPLADVSIGSPDAKIVVEEYASLTCVHCAAFANDTFPEIKAKYIDTGLVRFIVKPLASDPLAAGAFVLTRCDADAEFYPRLEHLMKVQNDWAFSQTGGDDLLKALGTFGFDREKFTSCLNNPAALAWVLSTRDDAVENRGITATPSFIVNGTVHRGNKSVEEFSKILDELLDKES